MEPIVLIVNCLFVVSLSGIQIEIVLTSMLQRLDEFRAAGYQFEVFNKVAGSFLAALRITTYNFFLLSNNLTLIDCHFYFLKSIF